MRPYRKKSVSWTNLLRFYKVWNLALSLKTHCPCRKPSSLFRPGAVCQSPSETSWVLSLCSRSLFRNFNPLLRPPRYNHPSPTRPQQHQPAGMTPHPNKNKTNLQSRTSYHTPHPNTNNFKMKKNWKNTSWSIMNCLCTGSLQKHCSHPERQRLLKWDTR